MDHVGIDDPPPDERTKLKLRQNALNWLRREFSALKTELESGDESRIQKAIESLKEWLADPDLNRAQGENLKSYSDSERVEWQTLWEEVESLSNSLPQ